MDEVKDVGIEISVIVIVIMLNIEYWFFYLFLRCEYYVNFINDIIEEIKEVK